MTRLAHPNGDVEIAQHVAREAFVNALNDGNLQVAVREKLPATIEEAITIALRLDAYWAALQVLEAPPADISKGEAPKEHRTVNIVRSSGSETEHELQMELRAIQREFDEYKRQVSSRNPQTPRSSPKKSASSPRTNVPTVINCPGATAGQTKGRGKRGGPKRTQCSNCDKFGHRDKDCMRPCGHYSPSLEKCDVEIKTLRSSGAKAFAKARFGERDVACTLDSCTRRNKIDPDLVVHHCIEPIDDDEFMYGKPDPKAMGRYCAVFRINQSIWSPQLSMLCPARQALH